MTKLTKSQRKYVRQEKAEIRRNFSTKEERLKQVDELYKKFEKHVVSETPKVSIGKPKAEKSKESSDTFDKSSASATQGKEKKGKTVSKNKKNDNPGNLQPVNK